MSLVHELLRHVAAAATPVLCACAIFYFGYHLVEGDRGLYAYGRLVQEIAVQLWRAFPKYDGARAFPTWMYRVALNVGISHLRERSRYERHHEPLDVAVHDTADANSDPAADARVRELYRCIARLDPFDRALLILYLDERSQRDIAEILGISETNVATKIGRLKERLRNDMSEA